MTAFSTSSARQANNILAIADSFRALQMSASLSPLTSAFAALFDTLKEPSERIPQLERIPVGEQLLERAKDLGDRCGHALERSGLQIVELGDSGVYGSDGRAVAVGLKIENYGLLTNLMQRLPENYDRAAELASVSD